MTEELEIKLEKNTDDFIKKLDGRFSEFVSDKFIKAYLKSEFMYKYRMQSYENPENISYSAAVTLFEALLEHGCGAMCNGHHVAQDYAAYFKNF